MKEERQEIVFGARRALARILTMTAGIAAGSALAADPSVTLPAKFEAPTISGMPLGLGASLPPNIMLLLNTGSVFHYGYLPSHADRYDLRISAYGYAHVSSLNKPFHSSHINKIYYNPAVEYVRPYGINPKTGVEFRDANFYGAPLDGFGVISTTTANLANNFHATNFQSRLEDAPKWVQAPRYKTDGTAGPSTGVTIGAKAHYNLYHPGRVAVDADGAPLLNPADGKPVARLLRGGQYIINKPGEAVLTYGTSGNPERRGCEFMDVVNGTDYSKFGKFGQGNADYIFPTNYGGRNVTGGGGYHHLPPRAAWLVLSANSTDETRVIDNPQYQFSGTYEKLNWMIKYYNCFEAIRVGEAEDRNEYYTWWNAAKRGRPITATDKRQNFANWYSYYYHPGSMMKTVLSHALEDLDPDTRVGYAVSGCDDDCDGKAWGNGRDGVVDAAADGITTSAQQYVKRGVRPYRDFDKTMDYPACPNGKCKTELRKWLFGLQDNRQYDDIGGFYGDASLRLSLAAVGSYYMNTSMTGPWSSTPGFNLAYGAAPTRYQSCRKSYALIMAGGSFDERAPSGAELRDADGKPGIPYRHASKDVTLGYVPTPPFRDHAVNTLDRTTLADVAMFFWKTDLFPGTNNGGANNVPTSAQDPAFWQHMNVVAIHTDADAYSVDWKKIVKAMEADSPAAASAALGYNWGYPGPTYAANCTGNANWTSQGCPKAPMSGWGNPDAGSKDTRREEQPYNMLSGDDLMHAAINSRGFYASTLDPSEISRLIKQGLSFTRKDNAISMSASATNAASPNAPMLYQAAFNDDWNGKLIGNRLCTAADVARDYKWDAAARKATTLKNDSRCAEEGAPWFKASWDAGIELQKQVASGGRNILAWNPDFERGVSFQAGNLTGAQKTAFCQFANCLAEVAYFYGDASNEQRNNGPWRSRVNAFKTDETKDRDQMITPDGKTPRVLGDIINSSPLFVGRDDYGWASFAGVPDDMRQAYRLRKTVNRTEVIYAGANDGMLHAFNAAPGAAANGVLGATNGGGKEIFAYVPNSVWHKLKALRDPGYTHEFYVDGAPVTGDAYLQNSNSTNGWNTVLIGSAGMGGAGYFALDIEQPEIFGASNVLWDASGPSVTLLRDGAKTSKTINPPYTGDFVDLGYSVGQASIIALKSTGAGASDPPKWFAMFANGYNSYLDRPMLYIVDLATGEPVPSLRDNLGLVNAADANTGYKTEGPTKPNGLSTPIAVDLNSDGLADVIYAGDLRGNLWRFR
ncbi:MAG: hypothetical protein LBD68_03575, partial [Zoogloeaceae bacterium]|nr:hypothetical protein [Zoogloeaceae bacterium]